MTALYTLPAHVAAQRIRQGTLKPSDLMHAYLDRIAMLEDDIGAFQTIDVQACLNQASTLDKQTPNGLLFGIPVGVKDLIDTIDFPTTYGSPIYAQHKPDWDAPCVVQVKQQGGLVMGKTVTTEFAIYQPGKTANPANIKHTPGGSSSGSAAAVAAQFLPVAFGTQTAASIYRPAAYCGVVGYKPTFGLINRAGVKPLADSFDTVGTLANHVADAALLAASASGAHHLLLSENLVQIRPKIGLFKTAQWDLADKDSQFAVLDCAERLRKQGFNISEIECPDSFRRLAQAQIDIMMAEASQALIFEYTNHQSLCSEKLVEVIHKGLAVDHARLLAAHDVIGQARLDLAAILSDVDLLLSPAATGQAPSGLQATGDPIFGRIWSALGNPGIVLPYPFSASPLPVGVLFSALHHQDHFLLQATQHIEALLRS